MPTTTVVPAEPEGGQRIDKTGRGMGATEEGGGESDGGHEGEKMCGRLYNLVARVDATATPWGVAAESDLPGLPGMLHRWAADLCRPDSSPPAEILTPSPAPLPQF